MARSTKTTGEVARIEGEIAVLRSKLADHEHRHADALAALEEGREARRKLLTKDDSTVAAATKTVRGLLLAADDAGSLVVDYQNELADAERRLIDAKTADQRETAAAALNAIAEAASAEIADFTATAKAFMASRQRLLDSMPDGVGLLPGYHSNRPDNRPEGHGGPLSGREVVNAAVAEALYHFAPTMYDERFRGTGSTVTLARLLEIRRPHPSYKGDVEPGLSPAQAIEALIVKPARERARQILAGDVEPALDDIRKVDHSKPPEVPTLEIIATKPLIFVTPNGFSHLRQHLSEGQRESVIEPIARLAIAKRAALELNSPPGQDFMADYEKRLKAGRIPAGSMRSDTVDLGDPMGCLAPANDDEIAEEVTRALG